MSSERTNSGFISSLSIISRICFVYCLVIIGLSQSYMYIIIYFGRFVNGLIYLIVNELGFHDIKIIKSHNLLMYNHLKNKWRPIFVVNSIEEAQ